MRTSTLLSITLLGLLLWTSCSRAEEQEAGKEAEADKSEKVAVDIDEDDDDGDEEPEKEKTEEIEEDKDVMVLHNVNFDRALRETEYLLVEFYAPWCGHCRQLEPVFARAAKKLKEEKQPDGPTFALAKIDATEEKELAEEFNIEGFPTLKLFAKGDRSEPQDYTGKRTLEGIVQWIKRRASPGPPLLDSIASADEFIDSHNVTVVGFFKDPESESANTFYSVALDLAEVEFGLSSTDEVFQKFEVKADSVVLFKKFDEGRADFEMSEDGTLDKKALIDFINDKSLPLIIPFNPELSDKIFAAKVKLHSLLFINSSVESQVALVEETRAVARKYRGQLLFVTIDVTESVSHVLDYFGVTEQDVPTSRIVNITSGKKFAIPSGDLSAKSLEELCREVLEGSASAYFKSEEIPEDWDKNPVKVLVGKNFEAVALDPTKSVFVEFYAPWCGHCKQLEPVWNELGKKYADSDDIIIAKMDATSNEVESVSVRGFPTIYYYPAGEDKKVVTYNGKRDLETFSKFLDSGGELPEEESDDEDFDIDDDDDDDDKKDEDSAEESKEAEDVSSEKASKDEL